jgi:hypothetical protein
VTIRDRTLIVGVFGYWRDHMGGELGEGSRVFLVVDV